MSRTSSVVLVSNSQLKHSSAIFSNDLAQALKLADKMTISLCVGRSTCPLQIAISPQAGRFLELNPVMLNELHVKVSRKYGINKTGDLLQLGPVIGIMVQPRNNKNRPFGAQTGFIAELNTIARELGQICFAFHPGKINFHKRSVIGFEYEKNVWKKGIYPIPDVVYARMAGYSAGIYSIRRKLRGLGCEFINNGSVNKWQAYRLLSKNSSLKQYLPETRKANSSNLATMLSKYDSIYIKPMGGQQGKNIIKVTKEDKSNIYRYQYKVIYQLHTGTANNLNNLRQALERIMNGHNYIIQQRIKLLKVNGGIADVRVLVQKDDSGEWSVTGKAFRVGRLGSITSNISGGGTAKRIGPVLKQAFAEQGIVDKILQEIDNLALESARYLERKTSPMGELGIDIGIDVSGRVWFIEANSKPARRLFRIINDSSTRYRSVKKPLLYASYLAGIARER